MILRLTGAAFVAAAIATPAFAHARLEQQYPRAGATLAAAPAEVQLSFSEEIDPDGSGVTVTGAKGRAFTAGAPKIGGQAMDVQLKPLPSGRYHVAWHALSVDGHHTEGGYDFTVGR